MWIQTKWRIHANEWRWWKFPSLTVLLCFIFLLFFYFSLFLFIALVINMIKKSFLTPTERFSIIIVNQRMVKLLEKVFCHRLWKIVIATGNKDFLLLKPNWKLGGATIAQVTLQNHSNILCFSRCTFRKSYFPNKIQCLRWWYEPVNFEFQWGKTPMSTWAENKRWHKAKRQMEVSQFLNTLCAFGFKYM